MRGVDPNVAQRLVDLGGGVLVEQDVLNVVEKIRAYDPNLEVQFLDPGRFSDITDAPYRVMELCADGAWRVVMTIWELDERVLERLAALDTQKNDILAGLDKANNAAKERRNARFREEIASVSEMAAAVLRSPKDTYKATNPVTGQEHEFRSIPQSDD